MRYLFVLWILKLDKTREELLAELKNWYDGYAWRGDQKVYNPFSVLNFLASADLQNYWAASGSPLFLIKLLQQNPIPIYDWVNIRLSGQALEPNNLRNLPLAALLFQTGYLTITAETQGIGGKLYTLNFPNAEVRETFLAELLPTYNHEPKHPPLHNPQSNG